ncbi:hypothetical protein VPH35_119549 [Triticum aestivum]
MYSRPVHRCNEFLRVRASPLRTSRSPRALFWTPAGKNTPLRAPGICFGPDLTKVTAGTPTPGAFCMHGPLAIPSLSSLLSFPFSLFCLLSPLLFLPPRHHLPHTAGAGLERLERSMAGAGLALARPEQSMDGEGFVFFVLAVAVSARALHGALGVQGAAGGVPDGGTPRRPRQHRPLPRRQRQGRGRRPRPAPAVLPRPPPVPRPLPAPRARDRLALRSLVRRVYDCVDTSDPRPVAPFGHDDPSAFACFASEQTRRC